MRITKWTGPVTFGGMSIKVKTAPLQINESTKYMHPQESTKVYLSHEVQVLLIHY